MIALTRALKRLEEVVAVSAYFLMTAMIAGEIFAREFLGTTIFGSEKVAILSSVVAGFVGFALVTQAGTHLRMSAFDGLVPDRYKEIHHRVGDLISVGLLCMLAWIAFEFVVESIEFSEQVAVLYIPRWPFQSVIAYAFFVSALRHLTFFLHPDARPETNVVPIETEET